MRTLTSTLLFLFLSAAMTELYGQSADQPLTDSSKNSADNFICQDFMKKSILPLSLIGLGSVLSKSAFEKELQETIQDQRNNKADFPIDDYIQYVPLVEIYLGDVIGLKAKHHWFDQTKCLLMANALSAGITHGLKHLTQKQRPNGSNLSFPSGHTSFAFTNATALQYEFQDASPVYAYSGYVFALTAGTYRIINNAHYLSDVLVGAGIGLLSTKIVYYFEPFKKFNPFKQSMNLSLFPRIEGNTYGFYAVYNW